MDGTRSKQKNMMEQLGFFIGDWNLKYNVPKSRLSESATGTGLGTFRWALHDKYIYFDYACSLTIGDVEAHGIFAWDPKTQIYRFWWFEDSGSFSDAAGDFVNDETLFLKWHGTSLIQTFKKIDEDRLILRMEDKTTKGKYEFGRGSVCKPIKFNSTGKAAGSIK